MEDISKDDFDKLVSHTARIEMVDGGILHYEISAESKKAFRELLLNDGISSYDKEFLWFYIPEDRLVLINQKDIIRITFLFDMPTMGEAVYFDNFKIMDNIWQETEPEMKEEENEFHVPGVESDLPQLIMMHRRKMEDSEIVYGVSMKTEGYYGNISFYTSLSKSDIGGLDFVYHDDEEEWVLLTYKYFQFIDEDGEENFMPLKNLSVIEIERSLIMPDQTLDLYLGRDTK